MDKKPKTTKDFLALPIGPEDGRRLSSALILEDGLILGVIDATGATWSLRQYEDGELFRWLNG